MTKRIKHISDKIIGEMFRGRARKRYILGKVSTVVIYSISFLMLRMARNAIKTASAQNTIGKNFLSITVIESDFTTKGQNKIIAVNISQPIIIT